jgi:hypothetical protein
MQEQKDGKCLGGVFLFENIIKLIYNNFMAKVVAPLGSFSASGKIGKALVFFSHLGRNVVRGLVTPANPKTETQGDSRLLLGALGRSARGVARPSDYYTNITQNVPAGQTWVSSMISFIVGAYGSGATGVAALNAAFDGHSATNWEAQAAVRGLTDLTISYAAIGEQTITAGAQLYVLAQMAIAKRAQYPTLFNAAPYTTALASWTSANVVAHVAYLATEA